MNIIDIMAQNPNGREIIKNKYQEIMEQEKEVKQVSKAKKQLLDSIFNKIAEDKKSEATLIYNELIFILETTDKLKEEINKKGVVEHFINGKQDFLRESPSLSSYNKIMKTYDTFYKNLINLLDTKENPKGDVMEFEEFTFEMFLNDDKYDLDRKIREDSYYINADEKDKDNIYDTLMKREYEEYKKNPTSYLLSHKVS